MSYIKYILLTLLFSGLLVAVIVIPAPGKETAKSQEASVATTTVEQTITLTQEDIYKGDLILVNNQTPFHFETADKAGRVRVYGNKSDFYQVKDRTVKLSGLALAQMTKMMNAFYNKTQLSTTLILSGFRTKKYQQKVYDDDVRQSGVEHAKAYVAQAGFSEHHTGLAIDFGVQYGDGTTGSFISSENEKWMNRKAQKYGFILRYPDDKATFTGISGEAWHYRYVGVPHSIYIKKNKLCLEEYITFLQNNATEEYPLCITYKDVDYEIYYTTEKTITVPQHMCYRISGDNVAGFIVTMYPAFQAANVSTPAAIGVASGGAVQ